MYTSNQPASVNNAFPDMCVGRLSVKNGDTPATDTLSTLIYNLIDLESPITQAPIIDYRRRILRLAGAGQAAAGVYHQNFGLNNRPDAEWTADISNWMNYDYSNFYCGDGRWFTNTDLSRMESNEWVTNCIDELNRGAGVAFYTDHGEFHMFSAGLEWCPWFINDPQGTKGARDSTFNNYQIENYLNDPGTGYSAPFILSLSCLTGTYNHTVAEHRGRTSHPYFCFDDGSDTGVPPAYDFGTDCLAERLLKNTDVPVAGVFACSEISYMSYYEYYGKGILEAIFTRGEGRLGDAIAAARLQYEDNFTSSNGSYPNALGQFNLLGDPALDISDRVRFPSKCDLVVYHNDVSISEYPVEVPSGVSLPLRFTVYNNGAQNSGSFNTKIVIMNGLNISTINVSCASIDARDSALYEASWTCPSWFDPPMEIQVIIEVDDQHDCSDSWRGNNTSSTSVQLNDTYPVDSNWIDDYWVKPVEGVINTTPILTNLDSDDELEVVVLTGSTLSVYEHDGSKKWELSGEGFCGSIQPMAVDLDRDGKSELIVACSEGIKVIRSDASLGGVVQQLITVSSTVFTVGDMDSSTAGLELCTAEGSSINLYEWNNSTEQFEYSLTKRFTEFRVEVCAVSLCCADLGGSSREDAILCISSIETSEKLSGFAVYDWDNATTLYLNTWERFAYTAQPAVGELAGTAMVGFPFCQYSSGTEKPAVLVEPGQSTELLCEEGSVDAYQLNYGVFADWTAVSGADVFILPSEMQCFAWNEEGEPFDLQYWPTEVYSGSYQGASISPTALGDLNDDGEANVLFSASNGVISFGSDGQPPLGLDFPITLPDIVWVQGGFSIADIDEDGIIEIVFGSSDSRLHCWELGECTEGYAPWPQFQHDFGRTGVLE
jgi:hypothetical protein